MKKLLTLLTIIALAGGVLSAQELSNPQQDSYVKKNSILFFDPSKLSMHHSYTLGYYSGNGQSGSLGYYLNSIEYRFADPLKVRVDLGFLHNPGSIVSGKSSLGKSGVIVPGVSIDWSPSRYFNLRLDYRHVPYYNGSGYLNNYFSDNPWEDYRYRR
jgi:hypothetical protein